MHRTALFTLRWYMSARLLDAGLNVLSLDLDGYMMADIYALLRAPPMAQHDVVMTDVGFRRGVNCGFVYFNQVRVRALGLGSGLCLLRPDAPWHARPNLGLGKFWRWPEPEQPQA